jgi:glycogen debranching enzyme
MPLMIHYRLDDKVKEKLLSIIKEDNHFLTPHGLATESLKSMHYQSNGYWRGPIWAPVMLMFTSFLEEMGEVDFHKELVTRFFKCMKQNGMAENFDAKRGKGLVDPAFAWTSSVYLHYLIKYDFLNDKIKKEA